jgi:hypothetical protein
MQKDQGASGVNRLWWGILFLIVVPLYAIAVALVVRSGLFAPNRTALSAEDVRALWAFIGSGVAASVTLVGLLFTRLHNERTLALQREAENRLTLDTVVKSLDLVGADDKYGPSAKIAGALAALVHLHHPVVAMRTLGAALDKGAVDVPSATWLINEVFERGSSQSQLEAATLLDIHAMELCTDAPGIFYWPVSAEYIWPASMQRGARFRLLRAILTTFSSREMKWWSDGGRVGWALSLLDEVIQNDEDETMKIEAAVAATTILNVVEVQNIMVGAEWKAIEQVRSRVAGVDLKYEVFMLIQAQQKLREWAANAAKLN